MKSSIKMQRSKRSKRPRNLYSIGISIPVFLVFTGASFHLLSGPAQAFDGGSAWGTSGSASGTTTFAQSSALHANNGTAAVYVEQGRDAQLPGSTITTIGVFNQLSVIGDNNTLTTNQTGTNSGDVTSDTNLTYQEQIAPLQQTLFEQP